MNENVNTNSSAREAQSPKALVDFDKLSVWSPNTTKVFSNKGPFSYTLHVDQANF